jgi:hypothetical protein
MVVLIGNYDVKMSVKFRVTKLLIMLLVGSVLIKEEVLLIEKLHDRGNYGREIYDGIVIEMVDPSLITLIIL